MFGGLIPFFRREIDEAAKKSKKEAPHKETNEFTSGFTTKAASGRNRVVSSISQNFFCLLIVRGFNFLSF